MADFLFATRLNSFRAPSRHYDVSGNHKPTALDLVARAAKTPGLNAVDLNYPDHLEGIPEARMAARLRDCGLALNGYAMRYYGDPAFRLGAFTHPDAAVRRKAIDLTRRGIDSLRAAGGSTMTLWLGQDGFDYPFQADYRRLWDMEIEAVREVAAHDASVDISLEYKPNEPRAFALLPDVGTTLLALREIGAANLGVTLDFAHVLYAGEMPACAAALVARHSRLLGVHLNDGYAHRDDGLMAGSVHLPQTIELLHALEAAQYRGALYFDTFPDASGLDPVDECAANIASVKAMTRVVQRLRAESGALDAALAGQDAVASQGILRTALYGP